MRPASILKFLLLALPLLEIAVFIWVGKMIGVGWTILLIIATTVLGIFLLRRQGFKILNEFSQRARQGQAQPSQVLEGSFIFIGGFLLIIPGFITDIIGLLCLIPFLRRAIVKWIILALAVKPQPRPAAPAGGRIIDHSTINKTDQ
ncbi:MAG: FxsA family protein [Gammaproteobacteria bacterium]|nr:FxsA family protein [Gammaproteobacteria bacterium]